MEYQQHSSRAGSRDSVTVVSRISDGLERRWPVMLVIFLILMVLVALSGVWKAEYQGEMKLLVRRQRADVLVTPEATGGETGGNTVDVTEEDLNSEVELLNSADLLRKVVLDTGLAVSKGFSLRDPVTPEKRVQAATMKLSKQLTIAPVRKTDIISMKYTSADPQMITRVLTDLAAQYKNKHTEVERPSGQYTFFQEQRDKYHADLIATQQQLNAFTTTNGVVSAQAERDYSIQRMNQFSTEAAEDHNHIEELQNRIATLKKKLATTNARSTTIVRTSENPELMQNLKSTLLTLELKHNDLLIKYQPTYPLVQEVERQIAETNAEIANEQKNPMREETTDHDTNFDWIRSEIAHAETDLAGLQAKEADARDVVKEARAKGSALLQLGDTQTGLLDQEKTDEDNYLLYERKAEEARVSDLLDQRGILNVTVAEEPMTPSIPLHNPITTLLFCTVISAVISVAAGLAIEFLSSLAIVPRKPVSTSLLS